MIRDKSKIYGEPNNPNTVLATGTMTPNRLVVGAGNKGVKTFEPPEGFSLINSNSGIVEAFPLAPNKLIGTDANGNLVLKDIITKWRWDSSVLTPADCTADVSGLIVGDKFGSQGLFGADIAANTTNYAGGNLDFSGKLIQITKAGSYNYQFMAAYHKGTSVNTADTFSPTAGLDGDFNPVCPIRLVVPGGNEIVLPTFERVTAGPSNYAGTGTVTLPVGQYFVRLKIGSGTATATYLSVPIIAQLSLWL